MGSVGCASVWPTKNSGDYSRPAIPGFADGGIHLSTEIQKVSEIEFHGDVLQAIHDGETVWVSVKRVCEALGVSNQGQQEKLKGRPWACVKVILTHDTTGRKQDAFCIALDSLPMWLATIEASRVSESLRPKLERYQRECTQVLARHFGVAKETSTEVIPSSHWLDAKIANMCDAVAKLAEVVGVSAIELSEVKRDVGEVKNQLVDVKRTVDESMAKIHRMDEYVASRRRSFPKRLQQAAQQTIYRFYNGKCPCCRVTDIVGSTWRIRLTPDGQPKAQFDHWNGNPGDIRQDNLMLSCVECHRSKERSHEPAFAEFQRNLLRGAPVQKSLLG